MLYRSQLSNISRAPIHLPALPQVNYQQICQRKTVHNGDEENMFGELIVDRITVPSYPANIKLNQRTIIPPIRKRMLKHVDGHKNTPHAIFERNDVGNMVVHVKWNESCKCMRCKLMKNDYEVGRNEHYTQWGKYPCVPDAVINRDEQDSSDDDQG